MRLPIAKLLLVFGCVGVSWANNGYGYLPPDIPFVPGGSNTPATYLTPSTAPPTPTRPTLPPPPPPPPTPTRPTLPPPPPPPTPTRPTLPPPPPTPTRPTLPPPTPTRPTRPPPTPTRPTPPPPTPTRPTPPPTPTRPTPPPTPTRPTPPPPTPTRPTIRPPITTPHDHDHHHHHHHHHSDDPLQWLRDSVPGEPGDDYPIIGWPIPETGFTCSGKVQGFYADLDTRCQVFHVCNPDGFGDMTGIKFLCPNGTIFNQEHFTCEWWNQVTCGNAASFYDLNNEIGVVPADSPYRQTSGAPSFNVPVTVQSPNAIRPPQAPRQPQAPLRPQAPRQPAPRPRPAPQQPTFVQPQPQPPFVQQPQPPFVQQPQPPFVQPRPSTRPPTAPQQPAVGYPSQPDPPNALYTTPEWGRRQN